MLLISKLTSSQTAPLKQKFPVADSSKPRLGLGVVRVPSLASEAKIAVEPLVSAFVLGHENEARSLEALA